MEWMLMEELLFSSQLITNSGSGTKAGFVFAPSSFLCSNGFVDERKKMWW